MKGQRLPAFYKDDPPPVMVNSSAEVEINRRLGGMLGARFKGAELGEHYPHRPGDYLPQEDKPVSGPNLPRPAEQMPEGQSIRQQIRKVQDWRRKATTAGRALLDPTDPAYTNHHEKENDHEK